MKEALLNLLKIKSLITIAVMIVFVYLALTNQIDNALTMSIIIMVLTYYFNKREDKEEGEETND